MKIISNKGKKTKQNIIKWLLLEMNENVITHE